MTRWVIRRSGSETRLLDESLGKESVDSIGRGKDKTTHFFFSSQGGEIYTISFPSIVGLNTPE